MTSCPVAETLPGGLDATRVEHALGLLDDWTRTGDVPAAGVSLGGSGGVAVTRVFGRLRPTPEAPTAGPDTLFLVASITKPVTALAVMLLVERGLVALDDRVAEFVPEFAYLGKGGVRLRHLLTHTSGLPDMLPNNLAMRAAHAPLSRFIDEVAKLPLAFPPGKGVSYQSMGFAMLAEVVRRVSGRALATFLADEVFMPLGMTDTSLGWRPETGARIAAVRLEPGQEETDWNWNSPYWLGFGAPWGGLITSPGDLARLCRMLLCGGALEGVRVLSPATVRAMTSNQLAALPGVPKVERRCRPWGLGWRLNWPGHSAHFGDLLGPRAFGHWGATGTLLWVDPDADAFVVLLTTQPCGDDGRHLARFSNAAAAAIVGRPAGCMP